MSNEYFALDANVAALAQAFGEDMGDVKRRILKDATTFPTRTEMVAALPSLSDSPDGRIVFANGEGYMRDRDSSAIPDMPGWRRWEPIPGVINASDIVSYGEQSPNPAKQAQARQNLGLGTASTHSEDDFATAEQGEKADAAVSYEAQSASEPEKDQARQNLGLGSASMADVGEAENEVPDNAYVWSLSGVDVSQWGVAPGSSGADNIERLNSLLVSRGPDTYLFKSGTYYFDAPLETISDMSFVGLGDVVFVWNNLTPGIDGDATDRVSFRGITFTNDFDITQHDIGGDPSVDGQYSLFTFRGKDWQFVDCQFTKTYRQALRPSGGAKRAVVDRCRFYDLSREAFFAGQGTGWGHRITNSYFHNCGDDVVNFRNHHGCLFSDNVVDQSGVNRSTPGTGAGNSGQSNAALKVHGSFNVFSNNTFLSGGNRIFEVRASNPGQDGEGGAPVGNYFINNTIRGTNTVRGPATQAIAVAASEGGTNYFLDNHIEWIDESPAIGFIGPQEGWNAPPNAGEATSCVIKGNTIVNCSFPVVMRAGTMMNRVDVVENKFLGVTEAPVVKMLANGTQIENLFFKGNIIHGSSDFSCWLDASSGSTVKNISFIENETSHPVLELIVSGSPVLERIESAYFIDNSHRVLADRATVPRRVKNLLLKDRNTPPYRWCGLVSSSEDSFREYPVQGGLMTKIEVFGHNRAHSAMLIFMGSDVVEVFKGDNIAWDGTDDLSSVPGTPGAICFSNYDGNLQIKNNTGGFRDIRVYIG